MQICNMVFQPCWGMIQNMYKYFHLVIIMHNLNIYMCFKAFYYVVLALWTLIALDIIDLITRTTRSNCTKIKINLPVCILKMILDELVFEKEVGGKSYSFLYPLAKLPIPNLPQLKENYSGLSLQSFVLHTKYFVTIF